jgi:hypothetical protein
LPKAKTQAKNHQSDEYSREKTSRFANDRRHLIGLSLLREIPGRCSEDEQFHHNDRN